MMVKTNSIFDAVDFESFHNEKPVIQMSDHRQKDLKTLNIMEDVIVRTTFLRQNLIELND